MSGIANVKQLETARALPTRLPNGKRGKAFVFVTREAMPLLLSAEYRIASGVPPETEMLSFSYNRDCDRYEFLIESPFLPLVAEDSQVPLYEKMILTRVSKL
jgi:hypothetical protein